MLSYSYYESDNRVRRYAETLAQNGNSVDVIAIGMKGCPKSEVIKNVKLYRIQSRVRNEKRKIDYLLRILLFLFKSAIYLMFKHIHSPYSLIHVHSVPDFEVFAAIFPKLTGAKVILDIHDIVPEFYAGKFKKGKNNIIIKLLIYIERICCKFANHVIISNDLWRKVLTDRSVDETKCTSIINYPDSNIFKRMTPKSENVNRPFIAIYPGTLNYHQGLDIAVKAIHRVKKITNNIQFHIYGIGPSLLEIEKMITELDIEENVFLKGAISLEMVAQKMADADLGIVPKRADGFGNEAFSTKICEFMMMGIPVIAAETKIDRYYFNDSIIEFFKPGDEESLAQKIILLYNDKKRRDELIKNALSYITENSWDNMKYKYLDIVDRLCGFQKSPELEIQKS